MTSLSRDVSYDAKELQDVKRKPTGKPLRMRVSSCIGRVRWLYMYI